MRVVGRAGAHGRRDGGHARQLEGGRARQGGRARAAGRADGRREIVRGRGGRGDGVRRGRPKL